MRLDDAAPYTPAPGSAIRIDPPATTPREDSESIHRHAGLALFIGDRAYTRDLRRVFDAGAPTPRADREATARRDASIRLLERIDIRPARRSTKKFRASADIHRSGGKLLDNTRLTSRICGGSWCVN
jgi:hypothetical protein